MRLLLLFFFSILFSPPVLLKRGSEKAAWLCLAVHWLLNHPWILHNISIFFLAVILCFLLPYISYLYWSWVRNFYPCGLYAKLVWLQYNRMDHCCLSSLSLKINSSPGFLFSSRWNWRDFFYQFPEQARSKFLKPLTLLFFLSSSFSSGYLIMSSQDHWSESCWPSHHSS